MTVGDLALPHFSNYVISITTIPSRINKIQPVINSFINQRTKSSIEKFIYINIPIKYDRFDETITKNDIPFFLRNMKNVVINFVDTDFGPATKLLGLPRKDISSDTIVLITDDDTEKEKFWADFLIENIKNRPNSVTSITSLHYNNYSTSLIFGGGGYGFYNRLNLNGLLQFYEAHKSHCKYVDDDMFTYFLKYKNIQVNFAQPNMKMYIPEKAHFDNKLRDLGGEFNRKTLQTNCKLLFEQTLTNSHNQAGYRKWLIFAMVCLVVVALLLLAKKIKFFEDLFPNNWKIKQVEI